MSGLNLNQYIYLTPSGSTPGGDDDFILNLAQVRRITKHAGSGEAIFEVFPLSNKQGYDTIQVTLLFDDVWDNLQRLNRFPPTALQPQIP